MARELQNPDRNFSTDGDPEENLEGLWIDRYRHLAKYCREQASLLRNPEAERWARLAGEYEWLANVAACGISPAPTKGRSAE